MTSLGDEVFVLRLKGPYHQIEVYDVDTYSILRYVTVPYLQGFCDLTSCAYYHCLYVADYGLRCVHRPDLQGVTRWAVNDIPTGLSVNKAHNVLVTCTYRKIKEFRSNGILLREVRLPDDFITPWYAIELTTGQFVACHGNLGDDIRRVCVTSADGTLLHEHGGQPGSCLLYTSPSPRDS